MAKQTIKYIRKQIKEQPLLITTRFGQVVGYYDDGIPAWKGIPYATLFEDPRESRFRKAQPCTPWEGILKAHAFSPSVPQMPKALSGISSKDPVSETDLTLNIWRPVQYNAQSHVSNNGRSAVESDATNSDANDTSTPENSDPKPLPVFLWIYGGAFINGSTILDLYDGKELVRRKQMIVVTVNYRVGALGMMDFSGFDQRFESNVGLKDQLMALQWVYENIAAFGGDPNNITLAGQSAGANSVTTLLTVPQARPYIAKAAAFSSYPGSTSTKEQAKTYAEEFLQRIGIDPNTPGNMDKLYEMDAMELMKASVSYSEEVSSRNQNGFPFLPVIDGTFLPEFPLTAVEQPFQDGKNIPLLLGNCDNEGTLYSKQSIPLITTTEPGCKEFLQHFEGESDPKAEALQQFYQKNYGKKGCYAALGGDIVFRIPTLWYADRYSHCQPTYVYHFSFRSRLLSLVGIHTMHGCDIPFLFHTTKSKIAKLGLLLNFRRKRIYAVSDGMNQMLEDFCTKGTPGWEAYQPDTRPIFQIDMESRLLYNPLGKAMDLWSATKYYRQLTGGSHDK